MGAAAAASAPPRVTTRTLLVLQYHGARQAGFTEKSGRSRMRPIRMGRRHPPGLMSEAAAAFLRASLVPFRRGRLADPERTHRGRSREVTPHEPRARVPEACAVRGIRHNPAYPTKPRHASHRLRRAVAAYRPARARGLRLVLLYAVRHRHAPAAHAELMTSSGHAISVPNRNRAQLVVWSAASASYPSSLPSRRLKPRFSLLTTARHIRAIGGTGPSRLA